MLPSGVAARQSRAVGVSAGGAGHGLFLICLMSADRTNVRSADAGDWEQATTTKGLTGLGADRKVGRSSAFARPPEFLVESDAVMGSCFGRSGLL